MSHVLVTGGLGFIGQQSRFLCWVFFSILSPRPLFSPPPPLVLTPPSLSPPLLNNTGSHTVIALLEAGSSVTIVDNLSNSFLRVLDHVKKLAGDKASKIAFEQVSRQGGCPSLAAAALCALSSAIVRRILSKTTSTQQPNRHPHKKKQIDLRNREELDKVFAAKK